MDDKIVTFIQMLFNSITFDMFIKFGLLYFFIIWIAVLIWVIKDIGNRTNSLLLQVFAIFIIMFLTPLGIFIYLLIRPGKTLFEKYHNEIDDNLNNLDKEISDEKIEKKSFNNDINEKVNKINLEKCPKCEAEVKSTFHFCPNCKHDLNKKCKKCEKDISIFWDMCPYCGKKNKK